MKGHLFVVYRSLVNANTIIVFATVFYLLMGARVYAGMQPSTIVAMPEKGSTAIVVEKSTQTLFIFRMEDELVLDRKLDCSTGKMNGRKLENGDQKTPEGVYFFVTKYVEKHLSPVYGVFAFPMDYPNILDRRQGRDGSAIWLHGTDKDLKPMDSNGCIALENGALTAIEPMISLDNTPIIVSGTVDFTPREDNAAITEAVDSFLGRWAQSMCQGEFHDYLALYDARYCPDVTWWNEWRTARASDGNEAGPFSLAISQRGIYRDGDLLVTAFKLGLSRGNHEWDMGIRKLYIASNRDAYTIMGDAYKKNTTSELKHAEKDEKDGRILLAARAIRDLESRDRVAELKKNVRERLDLWVTAWMKGDMDRYGSCYSESFRSDGMDKVAWVERKRYLSTVYDYIRVTISDPVISVEGNRVRADFSQEYQSSGYKAVGKKTLVLENEDRTWKILQEIWKKN